MPRTEWSSAHRAEVNCRPWSELMSVGTPKRQIQWRINAEAQVAAVMSANGMASSHLVVRSMMVNKKALPLETGKGPTKSTCNEEKRS